MAKDDINVCNHEWKVLHTRQTPVDEDWHEVLGPTLTKRRKRCTQCEERITTYESLLDPRKTVAQVAGKDLTELITMGSEHAMKYVLNLFQTPNSKSDRNRADLAKWLISSRHELTKPILRSEEEEEEDTTLAELDNLLSIVPGA